MARIEEAIYSILSDTSANVYAHTSEKIYPYFLPQDCSLPAISFARINTYRESAFAFDPGYATARIQISVWTTNLSSGGSIADAVMDDVHRFAGTAGGVIIKESHIDNETVYYEDDVEVFQIPMDFMISYVEN